MDGRLLAAAALTGALFVGAARRGSRANGAIAAPLSEIQTQMLRVKNQYNAKPELAIRALDFIVTQLPTAGSIRTVALPGTHHQADVMLDTAKDIKGSDATLSDYLDELAKQIREDRHYAAGKSSNFSLQTGWERARYIPWMAREVVRTVEATRSTRTTTGRKRKVTEENQHKAMVNAFVEMRGAMGNVLDWIASVHADVSGLSYAQAKEQSDAWHTAQQQLARFQETRQEAERHNHTILPGHRASQRGGVVHAFHGGAEGWTVQRFTRQNQLHEEGAILGHCVGRGGYWGMMAQGRMMSLRDPENRPWMTLTMSEDNRSLQNAQGRWDRNLGHDRPHDVSTALTEVRPDLPEGMTIEEFLGFECKLITDFLAAVGGGRVDLGRHSDCVGIVAAWQTKKKKDRGATNRRYGR